jgi:hypothetical protein
MVHENVLYGIIIFQSILVILQRLQIKKLKRKSVSCPVLFHVSFLRKGSNMGLVFSVKCAAPVDKDVVERRLSVKVNDAVLPVKVFDSQAVDLGELSFADNDEVVLTLVDVDDAGNVSEPATLQFTAKDNVPPSAPGGFSVALVREE